MTYQETYKESGYIRKEGMGGFLNPPTHPEHHFSVSGVGFCQSLSASVDSNWLHDSVRKSAKQLLDNWYENKPALESVEVQEWIKQVMAYFANCFNLSYTPDGWNADKLTTNHNLNPLKYAHRHAGVHFIRKYYPEFKLEPEHLTGKWGQ